MGDIEILNELFQKYNIAAEVVNTIKGSTVTRYEVKVDPFTTKMEHLLNLDENIAFSLRAHEKPIMFPVYDRSVIAIDVLSGMAPTLRLKDMLANRSEISDLYTLPLLLGKTIDNRDYIVDLVDVPHLLIAGTTGSGKSVGLKSMVVALHKYRPNTEFVFIDPKCVELTAFRDIGSVDTEPNTILDKLECILARVNDRYEELRRANVSKISELNGAFDYVVVVIDELADMFNFHKMMRPTLCKIVQKSRAAGIHVIAATQRPSVDIVSGLIKSNFPGRMAYKVSSYEDSRTILNNAGAERLLGSGDMLYRRAIGSFERIQCPFVGNDEIVGLLE